MQWFGPPWPWAEMRASICENDDLRVDTPVGRSCLWCTEPIAAGDRGVMMPCVTGPSTATFEPEHIECMTRQTVGGPAHVAGRCSCTGGDCDPDMGMTAREAALWTWNWMKENAT